MTTNFYQDSRRRSGVAAPIKISLSHRGRTVYLATGVSVLPEQWDAVSCRVVGHPQRAQLNTLLARRKLDVDNALFDLQYRGRLHGLDAYGIRDALEHALNPEDDALILPRIDAYARRCGNDATRYTYEHLAKKLRSFDPDADKLRFEDITPKWLDTFNRWMAKAAPSQNARNILLRNLRTVFNDAIDDGATDCYPFRKYKIRPVPTKSRALTVEQCKRVFAEEGEYADMFKLSFLLGGISWCDLVALTRENVVGGRIEFRRAKTRQLCSVGIQREAAALLERYAGESHLVYVAERPASANTYLHQMNLALKRLGTTYDPHTKRWVGEAICPSLSHYWARYTVATLAAESGASGEAVGAMLGHSANTSVTSIYMRTNRNKQVDAALRAAIDMVCG